MRRILFVTSVTLLVLAAAVGLPIGAASPAAAHASLTSSLPEDGAELAVAPEEIVLTFNEELFDELVEVSILDGAGDLVMVTEAEQTPPPGTDVIVPWPADLPPGDYSVAFRVVSEDGHPVTGQVGFSYDEMAAPPTPKASATPEPEVAVEASPEVDTPSPQPEPTVDEPSPVAASPEEADDSASSDQAGEPDNSLIGPLLIAAAVIVGIGVVISIVMLARSRQ